MSSIILRSRVVSSITRSRFFYSNVASRESIIASQSIAGDQAGAPSPPPPPPEAAKTVASSPPPPPPPPEVAQTVAPRSKTWKFLKYGFVGSLIGATAAAGYVTYAYNSDEIDEMTKDLRASGNHTSSEDAPLIDKYKGLLYSAARTVPAKAIDIYLDLRRAIEEQVRGFTEPTSDKLLPDLHPAEQHVFTLVLDLNETLLYTDWKRDRGWRTFKRPGVDAFLEHLAKFYEIVVYSDQLNMYVDPICERLDKNNYIRYRLSRGATRYLKGKHFRDLSKLNRDPAKIIYVSGHAFDSCLQPENCVPVKPYKLEEDDTALLDLIPFLEYVARNSPADIRKVLASYERKDVAKEFLERSKEYQRKMQEQRQQSRFWRR
ncbi:NIF domain-containing protein [Cephalotus follicularis]|uniref:Mitochondrial import inner membrane translocase subunit TIM50 n=1 Tax=Cephalotus follicularis TaxID=3775 RepID=A0A1Q3BLA3_CEPFO|nr:NIF domain-containing protein [Cephalotus follicularis]